MATYKFSAMGPGFQCRDEVFEMGPIKISHRSAQERRQKTSRTT
jgi:hypothetical protein